MNDQTYARRSARRVVLRGLSLALGTWALAALTGRVVLTTYGPLAAAPRADATDAVCLLAALGACLLSTWLGVLLLTAALAALPGSAGRAALWFVRRFAPTLVLRLSAVLLGGTLLTSPGAPMSLLSATVQTAVALPGGQVRAPSLPTAQPGARTADLASDDPSALRTDAVTRHSDCVPVPGWSPTRPATPRLPADCARLVAPRPDAEHAAQDEVVVRRGENLWDIAARHLGPGASNAAIATEWPRWWRENHAVIGSDPDLLIPGQLLRPPAEPVAR